MTVQTHMNGTDGYIIYSEGVCVFPSTWEMLFCAKINKLTVVVSVFTECAEKGQRMKSDQNRLLSSLTCRCI